MTDHATPVTHRRATRRSRRGGTNTGRETLVVNRCEKCPHCEALAVQRRRWRRWLDVTDSLDEATRALLVDAYGKHQGRDGRERVDLGELADRTGLSFDDFSTAYRRLTGAGLVRVLPGGRWRIRFDRFPDRYADAPELPDYSAAGGAA